MKLRSFAICVIAAVLFTACNSTPSDWKHGKQYRWVGPQTGSNVGRWVEVPGSGSEAKPKSKNKSAAKKEEKKERDLPPAPPADRFR